MNQFQWLSDLINKRKIFGIIFLGIIFLVLFPSVTHGSGENWLGDWNFRKSHTISQADDAGVDYQITITVDFGDGVDSANFVYVNGKCETDFVDIRFTEDDGEIELDYWMESKTDSDSAIFWVEITDDLDAGNAIIFIYYGNDEVSSVSDGEATFLFFDGFAEWDSDKWDTTYHTGSRSISDGILTLATTSTLEMYTSNTSFGLGVIAESNLNFYSSDGTSYTVYGFVGGTTYCARIGEWSGAGWGAALQWNTLLVNPYTHGSLGAGGLAEYYVFGSARITGEAQFYVDRVSAVDRDVNWVGEPDNVVQIYAGSGSTLKVDWVLCRNFVVPEPAHSTWGEEEEIVVVFPVNTQLSITDMDDSNNIYAQISGGYTLSYQGNHPDGYLLISYVLVNITQGATVRACFKYLNSTNTFSLEAGSSEFTLNSGGCSASRSGIWMNLTISFFVQWDATEESDVELKAVIVDSDGNSDSDTLQTDYCDIVTNLVVSGFTCDDDRGNLEQTITFSGTVYYANNPASSTATTFQPPDAEYTSISIYDSGDNNKGTDSSIVSGAFSVMILNAPSTVGIETYNTFINMVDADYTDAEETSPTDTFITDRIQLLTLSSNDTALYVGEYAEIRVTAQLDYDDSAVGSGDSIIVEGLALSWDAGDSRFEGSETSAVELSKTYNEGSGSEATFGITSFDMNSLSVLVEWFETVGEVDVTDPGDIGEMIVASFIFIGVVLLILIISRRK